tara:strand:+ start:3275 stop:4120 length:846 start_codon:yes stop_codon:yes gene_type:complete
MSVVIVTHERPDFLRAALHSVFAQTIQPYEVIIINDCSVADYGPALSEFQESRINYLRLKEKSGANIARNTGVKLSSGDVVCFLDDDDVWLDDFLSSHQSMYFNDKLIGAAICGYRILGSQSKTFINKKTEVRADELCLGNRFSGMSGFSAKRSILLQIPFDSKLRNGQDWDLFVRLIQENVVFINIPKALFLYRDVTPGGISAQVINMNFTDIESRLKASNKHREWLGEGFYKRRVSEQLLSHLPKKKSKFQWVYKSIELAGFYATFRVLFSKTRTKFFQ